MRRKWRPGQNQAGRAQHRKQSRRRHRRRPHRLRAAVFVPISRRKLLRLKTPGKVRGDERNGGWADEPLSSRRTDSMLFRVSPQAFLFDQQRTRGLPYRKHSKGAASDPDQQQPSRPAGGQARGVVRCASSACRIPSARRSKAVNASRRGSPHSGSGEAAPKSPRRACPSPLKRTLCA